MMKKKYGGERNVLNSNLPIELKYLFENQYIQCMQILLVLFINRRKKEGITINELVVRS